MPDVVLIDIDIARTEAFIDRDFCAAYDGQTSETIDPSTAVRPIDQYTETTTVWISYS